MEGLASVVIDVRLEILNACMETAAAVIAKVIGDDIDDDADALARRRAG